MSDQPCPSEDGDTGIRCMREAGHSGPHWAEFEWLDEVTDDE